ncbi:hypothetical protein [Pseudomonas putida]|uniref:hypothetical protein n=1 Tax=Pseudomonas putida TaxID=303 RepID=UPI00211ABF0C|nr:hypothetical protein [Pseudomonas putida]
MFHHLLRVIDVTDTHAYLLGVDIQAKGLLDLFLGEATQVAPLRQTLGATLLLHLQVIFQLSIGLQFLALHESPPFGQQAGAVRSHMPRRTFLQRSHQRLKPSRTVELGQTPRVIDLDPQAALGGLKLDSPQITDEIPVKWYLQRHEIECQTLCRQRRPLLRRQQPTQRAAFSKGWGECAGCARAFSVEPATAGQAVNQKIRRCVRVLFEVMTAGDDARQTKTQISGNQVHLMLVYVPVLLKGLDTGFPGLEPKGLETRFSKHQLDQMGRQGKWFQT